MKIIKQRKLKSLDVTFEGLHVIGTDAEPFLLIRASDVVAFDVVSAYKNYVKMKRPSATVLERLDAIQKSFAGWGQKHGTYPLYAEAPNIENAAPEGIQAPVIPSGFTRRPPYKDKMPKTLEAVNIARRAAGKEAIIQKGLENNMAEAATEGEGDYPDSPKKKKKAK